MAEQKVEDTWILQHYNPLLKCRKCDTLFLNSKNGFRLDKETLTKLKEHLFQVSHNIKRGSILRQETEDKWVLQYYIPILKCQKCDVYFLDNINDSLSYEETLSTLKEHIFDIHNMKHDSVHNKETDENEEKIPVRRFIRNHYTKLKGHAAKCNHCFAVISYTKRIFDIFLNHLKKEHEDKLTEIEKNETKIAWYWDHFEKTEKFLVKCEYCKKIYSAKAYCMTSHLASCHKYQCSITGPSSIKDHTSIDTDMGKKTERNEEDSEALPRNFSDMTEGTSDLNKITGPRPGSDTDDTSNDTDMSTPVKKMKHEEGSEVLSKNLYEMAEGTSVLNESTPNTSESTDHVTEGWQASWEAEKANLLRQRAILERNTNFNR